MTITRRTRPLSFEELVDQVRREYSELPGLCLTQAQICRMWGVEPEVTRQVLDQLTAREFLSVTTSGLYMRHDRACEMALSF